MRLLERFVKLLWWVDYEQKKESSNFTTYFLGRVHTKMACYSVGVFYMQKWAMEIARDFQTSKPKTHTDKEHLCSRFVRFANPSIDDVLFGFAFHHRIFYTFSKMPGC